MKIRARTVWKSLGAAVLVLLIAGLAAPYLSADRYAQRLRGSLSRALGREVEFRQPVRFNLFHGPGFSADNVVIHEDPSIGAEPIAYIDSMDVRPSLLWLLGGRFVIASIRLDGADINLAKTGAPADPGRWNFLSFVNREALSAAPAIHIRNGRINFRFGDTKSVVYLMETDLDIAPPGSLGAGWSVSCTAKLARTDRPAEGLISFGLKGRWYVAPDRVDMNLNLEQSGLGEVAELLRGESGTVHGSLSARLRLNGTIDNITIRGRADVEDVHRWDMLPVHGRGWPFNINGRLSVLAQELDLQSNSPGDEPLPLWIRFRVSDYLAQPRWAVTVNWNRFPLAPMLELARHMGAELPPKLQLGGVMDGSIGYGGHGDLQGQVVVRDAALTIPESPPLRFDQADIVFDGGHVRLTPAVVQTADQDEARIQADYSQADDSLDLAISTSGMKVASLRAQAALAAVPWLEQVQSGQWSGGLHYHHDPAKSGWTGRLALTDAEIPVPGLASPLQMASVRAQIDGARVVLDRMTVQAGKVAFTGSYSYEPKAARPHRLRLAAASVDAADLEAELMPTLRRSTGILARALGRTSLPDWLKHRGADGSVQINDLQIAGSHLTNVRGHLLWDAARIQFDGIQARMDTTALSGRLSADIRGARPFYKLDLQVKGLNWQAGKLDGEANLATSGTGLQLVTNLEGQGTFTGSALDFGGLLCRTATGNYDLTWAQTAPRVHLSALNLKTDEDVFTGRGSTMDDGRLLMVLTNGTREVRVSGPWDRLRLEQ